MPSCGSASGVTPFSFVLRLLLLLLLFASHPILTAAQTLNGQFFTNGLSIIDAPQPNTPFHAGSNLPIAIEVSGNGKIPESALSPSSDPNLPTRYQLLEIYLVSSAVNLTVSSGPGLLANEKGSVRHFDFQIPTCVPVGQYNLTFYESSVVNSTFHFVITSIAVSIDNTNAPSPDQCPNLNPLQNQPQVQNPLPQSPFIQTNQTPIQTSIGYSASPAPTAPQGPYTMTVTAGQSMPPSTVTVSGPLTTMTIVMVSQATLTTTQQGQATTTTATSFITTTAVMNPQDASGFIPVNEGYMTRVPPMWLHLIAFAIIIFTACCMDFGTM